MNLKNLKNKKAVIIIIVILLIIGGIFYLGKEEEPKETYSQAEEYSIIETIGGKIIENKENRFKVQVPKDWKVEIVNDDFEMGGRVHLFNPQAELDPKTNFLIDGCGLAIMIIKNSDNLKEDAKKIREKISNIEKQGGLIQEKNYNQTIYNYEVAKIGNFKALKETMILNNETKNKIKIEQFILLKVPVKNKIYLFETLIPNKTKDSCPQEFNNFLKIVSINES